MNPSEIPGYAVDADPARRPGIPKERPPQPLPQAKPPAQQKGRPAVVKRLRAGQLVTPVFGTAQPARGFSGALRDWAYRYPPSRTRHWFALMFADRVNVWERRLSRLGIPGALAALLVGSGFVLRLARRAT